MSPPRSTRPDGQTSLGAKGRDASRDGAPLVGTDDNGAVRAGISDDSVTQIRNIGPAQAEALARAGITTATELREIGANDAYRRLLRTGSRPHFIMFYVLHMALQGRPWNDCKGEEKADLRRQFDAICQESHGDVAPSGVERILNEIGTGLRR